MARAKAGWKRYGRKMSKGVASSSARAANRTSRKRHYFIRKLKGGYGVYWRKK